jgi:hypothetical protein
MGIEGSVRGRPAIASQQWHKRKRAELFSEQFALSQRKTNQLLARSCLSQRDDNSPTFS